MWDMESSSSRFSQPKSWRSSWSVSWVPSCCYCWPCPSVWMRTPVSCPCPWLLVAPLVGSSAVLWLLWQDPAGCGLWGLTHCDQHCPCAAPLLAAPWVLPRPLPACCFPCLNPQYKSSLVMEELSPGISVSIPNVLILSVNWLAFACLQGGMTVHHIDVEMLHYAELHLLSVLLSKCVAGYRSQSSNPPIVFVLLDHESCDSIN